MGDNRLVELTEELYAAAPAGFVARRDELAKAARAEGERELATAIKALRRPTVGAWYLNAAARSGLTSLRELLRLGRDLRDAQSGGDFAAVRELAGRRNPLLGRVVRDLTAHLATVGLTATPAGLDEVRGTLSSALADPEVAAEVQAGRLDGPRTYAGFGEWAFPVPPAGTPSEPAGDPADGSGARERPAPSGRKSGAKQSGKQSEPTRAERQAAEREQAEREQAEREQAEREAAERRRAEAALAEAIRRRDRARAELEAAQAEVEALEARISPKR